MDPMYVLIPMALVVTVLFVLGYIAGTELCLPAARRALHTGETGLWWFACRLVAAGELALIAVCAGFLLIAENTWQLFSDTRAGQLLGLAAAAMVFGALIWEMTGRWGRHCARIMSTSLDLVLPATGGQRERYTRLRQRLEAGTPAEQRSVLQALLAHPGSAGD